MIAILAYWVLLFLIFLPTGIATQRLFKLNSGSITLTLLLGMFQATLLFTVAAFFIPLNLVAFSIVFALTLIFLLCYRQEIIINLKSVIAGFKRLPNYLILPFLVIFLCTLYKSAQLPSLVDNGTYYVQTVKWLNEYGFVKGLGNLHLFLAQTSGFHILEAGMNLSFLPIKFNDINGFIFLICTWYCLNEGYSYYKEHNKLHWICLIPLASPLFLIFAGSPSPDLPVCMVTLIILNLFLKSDSNRNYRIIFLLFVFLVFIKITVAPLALVLLLGYNISKNKDLTVTAVAVCAIWITKNIILSGYPFYPFTFMSTNYDWIIPDQFISSLHNSSNTYMYGTASTAALPEKLLSWVMMDGMDGILNKLIVVLFILMPFTKIVRQDKKYAIVYFIMLLHFILLLVTSPQARFFIPEISFFSAVAGSEIINLIKARALIYKGVAAISAIAVTGLFYLLTTPLQFNVLWCKNYSSTEYKKVTEGNLSYYTPTNPPLLYFTGNGPLPCVNEKQIKRFKDKYKIIPQLRDKDNMREGFYSEFTEN